MAGYAKNAMLLVVKLQLFCCELCKLAEMQ